MYRGPFWLGNNPWSGQPFFLGIILLVLWSVTWTGLALWHSAKRDEKGWFIWFLIVHTAGIIEIMYLVFVAQIFQKAPKNAPPRQRKK